MRLHPCHPQYIHCCFFIVAFFRCCFSLFPLHCRFFIEKTVLLAIFAVLTPFSRNRVRAARSQPVSDKQKTPDKDVFDGDSTALKPEGTSPVVTPDYPAEKNVSHGHVLPRASNATEGSALGDDDQPRTNAAASPLHADMNNENTAAPDDSLSTEGTETRPPAHPGAYDTTIARPESRKGLGPWSTRDHENADVPSSDVGSLEVPPGGHPALGGLATHKNVADGQQQLAPDTLAVLGDENNLSQNSGAARPDSAGDAAAKGVGSVPELAFSRASFGGGIGSESEGGGVASVTTTDHSPVQTVQGLTGRHNSRHGNAQTAEHGAGVDASDLYGLAPPHAAEGAESPRSGRQHTVHTARRSGGNFAEEQHHRFEAVGVGVKSRTDQSGGDGIPSHLDDNRRQRPSRQSESYGRAQVLRRQSAANENNNAVPETGEGHQRDQGFPRRESSRGIRRHDDGHGQQHRGVASGTGKPGDPLNRGVYTEVLKAGQKEGAHQRPGAIAGSCVGETRANRRPRKTSAAADGAAVGEGHRKPVRPVVEVPPLAVHPRVANTGIAGTAPGGDGTIHVYNIDAIEGNGEGGARGVRAFVPAATREVDEDVRRRIAGRSKVAAATLSIGGSLPHTKPASMVVGEPATRATGRMPKGGEGAAADERGQDIAALISAGAREVSVNPS